LKYSPSLSGLFAEPTAKAAFIAGSNHFHFHSPPLSHFCSKLPQTSNPKIKKDDTLRQLATLIVFEKESTIHYTALLSSRAK
jgi:hypothetical protein